MGDPHYQMVSQAYPFVARKVLRNERGSAALLQEMLLDPSTGETLRFVDAFQGVQAMAGSKSSLAPCLGIRLTCGPAHACLPFIHTCRRTHRLTFPHPHTLAGGMRATRLNALLNAALGYVASETSGFVDFDAVPEQGASLQVGMGRFSGYVWLAAVACGIMASCRWLSISCSC